MKGSIGCITWNIGGHYCLHYFILAALSNVLSRNKDPKGNQCDIGLFNRLVDGLVGIFSGGGACSQMALVMRLA